MSFWIESLLAVILLSLATGPLAPLVVARKYSFLSEALAHTTVLGICLSLIFFPTQSPLLLFLSTLLVVLGCCIFLLIPLSHGKRPADSLIGMFLVGTLGAGLLLHHLFISQHIELSTLLLGNILILTQTDLFILLVVVLLVLLSFLFFWKKWFLLTIEEDGALLQKLAKRYHHYLFFFILSLTIVCALKLSGALLINALLIIPGIFSLSMARNIPQTFIYSISFSLLGNLLGLFLCFKLNLPPGITLALTQLCLLVIIQLLLFLFRKVNP